MAFGLGVLRLPPAAFWAMTLREMAAATSAAASHPNVTPARAELEELLRRYPDG
jgi:uncharacterized phage protein (TIGR02216 family)